VSPDDPVYDFLTPVQKDKIEILRKKDTYGDIRKTIENQNKMKEIMDMAFTRMCTE
jgi:hypothetical protein